MPTFVSGIRTVTKETYCLLQGSLVRAIRQLSQVIRELESAISLMGEGTLLEKTKQANQSIQRDVMFAASLYL